MFFFFFLASLSGYWKRILWEVVQAAVTQTAPVLNIDPERLMALYDVNVAGTLRVSQAFTEMLVRTANEPTVGEEVTKATIMNIGSVAAWRRLWQFKSVSLTTSHAFASRPSCELRELIDGFSHLGSDGVVVRIDET